MQGKRSSLAALAFVATAGATVAVPAFAASPRTITISVVATTDVHGHAESLPWLGGHLANLRARRAADGGGVVLVDAGDMFQGTLESNLVEGAVMVRGYNVLGYTAAAIGNHEFDYGPAGPLHLARGPHDDPRGALKARAAEARFPFLSANVHERGAKAPVAWPNVRPFTLVTVAGVRVGIIGVATISTPYATHPRNFGGLEVKPLADAITKYAREARAGGANLVIVASHAGGDCGRLPGRPIDWQSPRDHADVSACVANEEIFAVARALPTGLVDLIAAGHTHQLVAHRVGGIPIVQALSEGRAFSRVDFTVDTQRGAVTGATIFPPRFVCGGIRAPSFAPDACHLRDAYEGRPVRFDTAVATAIAPDVERARKQRAAPVGVELVSPLRREVKEESPLGNFATDLMRAATPGADVAFINGGSLRSELPAGPLVYGKLYETFPFDDGLATVSLTAGKLASLFARNLGRGLGILSISGAKVRARCEDGRLKVALFGPDGARWPEEKPIRAVTNGYLASGGDGLLAGIAAGDEPDATPFRDRFAALLRAQGGVIRGDDPKIYSPRSRRLEYPGPRPVRCQ
jgi:2',3'-cyclic-nucleotide 2'-phosphodiesterase (5'-nucleotidase family)